jgi:hypothetical protein
MDLTKRGFLAKRRSVSGGDFGADEAGALWLSSWGLLAMRPAIPRHARVAADDVRC